MAQWKASRRHREMALGKESNVAAMLVNVFYNLMAVSPCIAGRFG